MFDSTLEVCKLIIMEPPNKSLPWWIHERARSDSVWCRHVYGKKELRWPRDDPILLVDNASSNIGCTKHTEIRWQPPCQHCPTKRKCKNNQTSLWVPYASNMVRPKWMVRHSGAIILSLETPVVDVSLFNDKRSSRETIQFCQLKNHAAFLRQAFCTC